ncbi:MAG: ABC transporter substrate-binding protein, partial [bacterium]|nr:ABC transporter substrate-binding protein [bacterium]
MRLIIILALSVAVSGCGQPSQKVIFRCDGGWYMPPAFHGNPYVAGGDGTHMHFIWNRLFLFIPATDEYIPRLGLSHSFSDDRTELTIKLREGVVWHDGTPFTARDVKATFLVKYASGWGEAMRIIEVPDDHTVVFKWRYPFGSIDEKIIFNERIMAPEHLYGTFARKAEKILVASLSMPLFSHDLTEADIKRREEVNLKKAGLMQEIYRFRPQTPTGTGPFKFSFVSASDLGMEKFADNWEAENISVDEVRMLKGAGNDMLWAFLISGEIDGSHPTTTQDVTEQILKLNPKIKLILAPEYGDIGFIINTTKPPMSDIVFRQALAHAVNKDKVRMISYYYSNTGEPYSTGVIDSLSKKYLDPAVMERMTAYEFNVLKARLMLEEAGYKKDEDGYYAMPDGTPIKVEIASVAGFSDWVLACESLSNQLGI